MKTSIMLVDDHYMFREGIGALINACPDLKTVGSAGNGKEALDIAGTLAPDLVIMDVSMPQMNGIETVRLLGETFPGLKVLALSGHREHHIIVDMLRAGACGYVLKDSPFGELLDAIHAVIQNRIFVSPAASSSLIMEFVRGASPGTGSVFSILTSRELEILQAVTEGRSTKEIASALSVSVKTIESHRQQIMDKLDIHSVAELTKYAIREEITPA